MFGNAKIKLIKTNYGNTSPDVLSKDQGTATTDDQVTSNSIIAEIDELEQTSTTILSRVDGEIRISMPQSIGEHFLLTNYREFSSTFDKITINLNLTKNYLDELPKHTDLLITHLKPKESFICEKVVGELECGLYAAKDFSQKNISSPLQLNLDELSCIHYLERSCEWKFDNGKKVFDIKTVRNLVMNDLDLIIDQVKKGQAVAVLPKVLVEEKNADLVRILPSFKCAPIVLKGYYSLKSPDRAALQAFIEFIVRRRLKAMEK